MNIFNVALDIYFNIKAADSEFFKLVGGSFINSLFKIVHNDDLIRLKETIEELKQNKNKEQNCAIRMRFLDIGYTWMIISMNYKDMGIDKEPIINARFIKLKEIKKELENLNNIKYDYRVWLSLSNLKYFKYDSTENIITIYSFNSHYNIEHKDYKTHELIKKSLNLPLSDKNFKRQLKMLIKQMKNCVLPFKYKISSSFFTEGNKLQTHLLNITPVFNRAKTRFDIYGTIDNKEYENISSSLPESSSFPDIDPLTGLYNKTAVIKYIKQKIENESKSSIYLAIIDVDNFKTINDTFGHLFGDKILKRVSELILYAVQDMGMVGRFGGDEFFIVFENIKDELELRSYLRSIRSSVELGFSDTMKNINLSCSIGCVAYPKDAGNYEDLFDSADAALYRAKENGKNRYVIYSADKGYSKKFHSVSDMDALSLENSKTEFFCSNLSNLFNNREKAINDILSNIGNRFMLDRIIIYKGNELKKAYVWGKDNNLDSAEYIYYENYLSYFKNKVHVINHIAVIEIRTPKVHKILVNQDTFSSISYLFGSKDDIKGLITYELLPNGRKWKSEEIFALTLFGNMLEQVITQNSI